MLLGGDSAPTSALPFPLLRSARGAVGHVPPEQRGPGQAAGGCSLQAHARAVSVGAGLSRWRVLPACPACTAASPAFPPHPAERARVQGPPGTQRGCKPVVFLPSPYLYASTLLGDGAVTVLPPCMLVLPARYRLALFHPPGMHQGGLEPAQAPGISSGSLLWREQTAVGCTEDIL